MTTSAQSTALLWRFSIFLFLIRLNGYFYEMQNQSQRRSRSAFISQRKKRPLSESHCPTVLLHLLGCWCNTKAIQIRNNIRLNNLRINQGSPEEFRMIQPNKETNLQHKVKRNAIRQRSNSSLQNRKERKDNPVSQPLCILGRISGVNGLERHVGGVEEGD
mmetsp:Transcript_1921/g.2486  ORF Transcript_1921/g.2486 Transcript_1921/m.2486 type:complete len:161 (+) Transcript_1921:248-730(+)